MSQELPEAPPPSSPPPDAAAVRRHVRDVRHALLVLHKKLLDAERARYERANGRVPGPGALLQLVLSDPWFAWLRPLSAFVVQVDERLEGDEPLEPAEALALLDQARALVHLDDQREGTFGGHYVEVVGESADVPVAYRALRHLLAR